MINTIDEFKTMRFYPDYTKQISMDTLKKQYIENITKSQYLNNTLIKNPINNIRIMTYNVHFWTNVDEESNLQAILNDIRIINPDILCLNEVTLGKTKYNDQDIVELFGKLIHDGHDLLLQYENYDLLSFCNITPSWFNTVYGNAVFIKKKIKKLIQKDFANKPNIPYSKICGSGNRCLMGQYNHVYDDLECCKKDSLNKFPNDKETRCFIKFSLPDFDIICTHLEAYDVSKREKELREIDTHISRSTIILGDFNMISEQDYTQDVKNKWIDHNNYSKFKSTALGRQTIDELGWEEITGLDKINMTVWNGTRVDYIFYKNIIKYPTFYKKIVDLKLQARIFLQYDRFFKEYQGLIDCLKTDGYDVSKMTNELETFNQSGKTGQLKRDFIAEIWDNVVEIYKECHNCIMENHISNSGVYFTSSSDHLPLYVDIKYTFKSLITKGLEGIENNVNFLENNFIKLTTNEFIEYWNKMCGTSHDENSFYIYNGQPSASYTWINFQSKFNDFKDPYNYGTSKGSNSLGNNGLYGARDAERAIEWATDFVNSGIASRKIQNNNKNFIVHELKINFDQDIQICYIGSEMEWQGYPEDFDQKYDIIVGEHFKEIKITSKSFENGRNKYVSIKSKYYYKINKNEPEIEQDFLNNYTEVTPVNDIFTYTNKDIYPTKNHKPKKYDPKIQPSIISLSGGNNYKEKYLKYKKKYLDLKKNT